MKQKQQQQLRGDARLPLVAAPRGQTARQQPIKKAACASNLPAYVDGTMIMICPSTVLN
jgi:hypothetical protein